MIFKMEVGKKYKLEDNSICATIIEKKSDNPSLWRARLDLPAIEVIYDEFGECVYYIDTNNGVLHSSNPFMGMLNIEGYSDETNDLDEPLIAKEPLNFCTNHEYVNVSFFDYPGDFRCKHCGKKRDDL